MGGVTRDVERCHVLVGKERNGAEGVRPRAGRNGERIGLIVWVKPGMPVQLRVAFLGEILLESQRARKHLHRANDPNRGLTFILNDTLGLPGIAESLLNFKINIRNAIHRRNKVVRDKPVCFIVGVNGIALGNAPRRKLFQTLNKGQMFTFLELPLEMDLQFRQIEFTE